MASERYFANLNPFPITLPSPRGGQRTVSPNEVVQGDWWSRLGGNRQLTEIDPSKYSIIGRKITQGADIRRNSNSGAPVRERPLIPRPPKRQKSVKQTRVSKIDSLADDVCQSGCEANCEGACELNIQGIEELEHMKRIADVYFCNYCSENSTVKQDIIMHQEREHPEALGIKKKKEKGPEGEAVVPKPKPVEVLKSEVPALKSAKIDASPTPKDDIDGNDRFADPKGDVKDAKKDEKKAEPNKEDSKGSEEPDREVVEDTDDYLQYSDGSFKCKECGKEYKKKPWLVKHINENHRG